MTHAERAAEPRQVKPATTAAAAVAAASTAAPFIGPTQQCNVCLEDRPKAEGVLCGPTGPHFYCRGCLQDWVTAQLTEPTFTIMAAKVATYLAKCVENAAANAERDAKERAKKDAERMAAAAAARDRAERLRQMELALQEALILTCPRCTTAIDEVWEGCDALLCGTPGCGAGICALCLADCGRDAHTHLIQKHGSYWTDQAKVKQERGQVRAEMVAAVFAEVEDDTLVAELLRKESVKKHLRDLHINADTLIAGIQQQHTARYGARGGARGGAASGPFWRSRPASAGGGGGRCSCSAETQAGRTAADDHRAAAAAPAASRAAPRRLNRCALRVDAGGAATVRLNWRCTGAVSGGDFSQNTRTCTAY
jgi:hypothetical protein